jgi:hypothetical protein
VRHEHYYQQKITPCNCGSTEPYWHGPKDGERFYCCDSCWAAMVFARVHAAGLSGEKARAVIESLEAEED